VAEHALDHLIESGDADRLEVGEFVFDLYERDRVVEGHVEGRVERLVGSRRGRFGRCVAHGGASGAPVK